jgi:hypothetical protein
MTRGPHADGQAASKNRGGRTRLVQSPPSKTLRPVISGKRHPLQATIDSPHHCSHVIQVRL